MPCAAVALLDGAQARTGSLISVGLEPCAAYLPPGWPDTIESHARFLRLIIESTADIACAYKPNLAFFEALGAPGWTMLDRLRAWVPTNALYIADGKRGDIGSTAERYATSVFTGLGFDAATVNPLMGRDALDPFLAHSSKLTIALALTSNPGASDFLSESALWRRIIEKTMAWSAQHDNAGFVVGATRTPDLAEARRLAGDRVILVPGVGAQGGDLDAVVRHGALPSAPARVIGHVTRGILPTAADAGRDPAAIIRAKAADWNRRITEARKETGRP
jgi:orotidine-5'-phosphate decarboxylase